jgi:SSS family solute:Na+ symporter
MDRIRLSQSDYVVVIGYFVLVLWIGLWFRRRLIGTKDYFAGGNQIPWWMAGISHYMSSFSAFSFIAYAQLGYMYGWVSITLFWVTIPACLAGGLFFASRWRRARVITPVQFVEARYNSFLRQLFAWAGMPMKIFDDALKIFATGIFVSLASGADLKWSIAVCGIVMVAYTFFGGLWALVVTDYVQFLMKALAMLLLLPLAIIAAGGMHAAFTSLPTGFFSPVNGPIGWTYILGFAAVMIVSYNASWSLAQKYYSVRDEREAAKAAYCSAALNFIGAPLMILPALIARHILPELASQGRTSDTYVLLVMRLLPAGMVGIIMAAMFSATMAAVSADFNAIASVLTQDVYGRLIRRNATEPQLLRFGRRITLALGIVTTALSLWIAFMHQQSLFNVMVTVLGLFMAPTLLPLLAGLMVRRITWQGAFAGFLSGLAVGFLMLGIQYAAPNIAASFGSSYNFEGVSLLLNTAATIAGMYIGSLLSHRTPEESERVAEFFAALDTPIHPSEVPLKSGNPAAPVLAISTFGVGLLIAVAGLIAKAPFARNIDVAIGVVFVAAAALLRHRVRRTSKI